MGDGGAGAVEVLAVVGGRDGDGDGGDDGGGGDDDDDNCDVSCSMLVLVLGISHCLHFACYVA